MIDAPRFEKTKNGQVVICDQSGKIITDIVLVLFVTKQEHDSVVEVFKEFDVWCSMNNVGILLCPPSGPPRFTRQVSVCNPKAKRFDDIIEKKSIVLLKGCIPSNDENDLTRSFSNSYPCIVFFKDSVAISRHYGPWDEKTLLDMTIWVNQQKTRYNQMFGYPMTSLLPINITTENSESYNSITFERPNFFIESETNFKRHNDNQDDDAEAKRGREQN